MLSESCRLSLIGSVTKGTRASRSRGTYQCSCGSLKEIEVRSVDRGLTKSCGCLSSETVARRNMRHGQSKSKQYEAWCSAKQRCTNPSSKQYSDYGGRGISFCDRWCVYENFLADMGSRPEGMTLERRDNSMGYSPENCYWASTVMQANNKRTSVRLTIGEETLTIAEWSRRVSVSYQTIHTRYKRGLPHPECVQAVKQKVKNADHTVH